MKNNPIANFMHINVSICKFPFQMSRLIKEHIQCISFDKDNRIFHVWLRVEFINTHVKIE